MMKEVVGSSGQDLLGISSTHNVVVGATLIIRIHGINLI